MSSKKDWTDSLPELLEGYSEAEPEGLWDAVRAGAGMKQRRAAGAWWYAGGTLLAAAAVAVVVLIWPVKPSADISLVPGDVVADRVETADAVPEVMAAAVGKGSETAATLGTLRGRGPALLGGVERSETVSDPLPTAAETQTTAEVQIPAEAQTTAEVQTPTEPVQGRNKQQNRASGAMTKSESKPESRPEQEYRPVVRRKPSSRVQLGFTTTGLLSEAVSVSTTGTGIPSMPGTRASASSGSTVPGASMFSRNKASTTDARHSQSERIAFGVRVNLNSRWGFETGIVSTTLMSDFSTTAGNVRTNTERSIKYRGIPLFICFNVFELGRLSMYLNAGPMYEYTTHTDTRTISYVSGTLSESKNDDTLYEDSKWSLNAGAGLQLGIFTRSALFIEPGVSLHFPDDSSLETFYTEHPVAGNLTFGYRLLF